MYRLQWSLDQKIVCGASTIVKGFHCVIGIHLVGMTSAD